MSGAEVRFFELYDENELRAAASTMLFCTRGSLQTRRGVDGRLCRPDA